MNDGVIMSYSRWCFGVTGYHSLINNTQISVDFKSVRPQDGENLPEQMWRP